MKITDPNARNLLAAEYVLGTLQGRARARFELWLRSDPALRREVAHWQQRLEPLSGTLTEVEPSAGVWTAIEARIQPKARVAETETRRSWLDSLAFWRWSSMITATLAVIMFGYVALTPVGPAGTPDEAMVVVMADPKTEAPMMTVAWMPQQGGNPRLKVRVIGHQTMEPETAWELWMLPGGNQPPRSLGLITTHENQTVEVPASLREALNAAAGMAMSIEPKGGSPTGKPSGPVLYSGQCVKI